jgi:hypothetical protein
VNATDEIALAALAVSIVSAFVSLAAVIVPLIRDRSQLSAEAQFVRYYSADAPTIHLRVTISNVGRTPIGVRHVGLVLSKERPTFVAAADNPLRYAGSQRGIIARGEDEPLHLDPRQCVNLPPTVIDEIDLRELGPTAYLAVEDSTGKMRAVTFRNQEFKS